MKLKRKSLLIALAVVVVLGCGGAYLGARYVLIRRMHSWRQQGIAASIAGDNVQAVNLLVRYLNRQPQDVEALSYYVKSRELVPLSNGQHLAQTISGLKMLLTLDPSRVADRRHLLELYFRLDRSPEALDTANQILAKYPADVRSLEIKTRVLMQLREDHDAMDTVEAWAAAAPSELQPQMMRLTLEVRLGHSTDVIVADAQKLRLAHPGDPRFEFLQGFAYSQAGDDTQAIQWLRTAAQHPRLSDELVKLLVRELDNLGLSNDSLALLQRMAKEGGSRDLRYALAERYWEMRKWDDLAATLADLDLANPATDATLIAMKENALSNLGRAAEADTCAKALSKRAEPTARAWTLILHPGEQTPLVSGKDQARALMSAASMDPRNPYIYYFLGDCEMQLGEQDLAIEAFQNAMELDSAWSAPAVRLVETLLQKGQPERAFTVASIAIHHSPSSVAAVVALARAWSAGIENGSVGNADDLMNLVDQIQSKLPNEDRAPLIAIQLLAERGKKDEASRRARAEIARSPAHTEQFFLTLATISRKFGLGIEQECFDKSESAHGVTPLLACTEAIDRFLAGHGDDAPAVFDKLAAKGGNTGGVGWKLARARLLDMTNSPDARSAWNELGNGYPGETSVQQAVISAQAVRGDWAIVQPAIDRMRVLTGENGLAWRLAQARLMVEYPRSDADCEKAAVQLRILIEQYSELPEPHVLLAQALMHLKRVDGAIQQFYAATQLDPTDVSVALQLAAVLQSQGDFQRAQQELYRIMPQLHSESQRQAAAMLLARQGNPDSAAKLLERPSNAAGEMATDQNKADLFLALLYRQKHDYERAEAIVSKLLQHPDVATVQFAASLFTTEGKAEQAKQTLKRLDTMKLDPGVKELILASHSAETGDLEQAESFYRASARENPADTVAWRLLAACQMGLGQPDAAVATLADAARAVPGDKGLQLLDQQSSLLHRGAGDAQQIPVVVAILRDPLNSDTDLEILRDVVASLTSNDREQLASRLQDIVNRHPESLDAQMELLQCYQSMGRYTDVLAVARNAINSFPTDTHAARVAVNICEMARLWKDLEDFAEILKRRSPGDAQDADMAIAMSQIGRGLFGAAIDQLAPYLSDAAAHPDRYGDLLSLYACALASNGRGQEAGDLLWPFVGASPIWQQRWISIARDFPDTQESAAWLDRLAGVLPANDFKGRAALAEAYNYVGHRGNNQSLIQKSTELFATVSQSPGADAASLLTAAVHAEDSGDWSRAQADYRLALAKNPSLYVAANNLAMLIVKHGGDLHEAVALAQTAVQLQPQVATLYDSLAAAQHAAGNAQAAIDEESTAIRLDPDTLDWKVRSAQYQLDAGNRAAAAKIIQDMDLKGPNNRSLPQPLQQQLDQIRARLKNDKLG
jgi:tetratricopeptide (TPR) repeat protein